MPGLVLTELPVTRSRKPCGHWIRLMDALFRAYESFRFDCCCASTRNLASHAGVYAYGTGRRSRTASLGDLSRKLCVTRMFRAQPFRGEARPRLHSGTEAVGRQASEPRGRLRARFHNKPYANRLLGKFTGVSHLLQRRANTGCDVPPPHSADPISPAAQRAGCRGSSGIAHRCIRRLAIQHHKAISAHGRHVEHRTHKARGRVLVKTSIMSISS